MLDTDAMCWSEVGTGLGPARWNHCAVAVEALPAWKIFVFGGSASDGGDGVAPTVQGTFQKVCCITCCIWNCGYFKIRWVWFVLVLFRLRNRTVIVYMICLSSSAGIFVAR